MNNILIPTDFSLAAMDIIPHAVKQLKGRCNIYLFHAFDMPESLTDAIGRSGIFAHGNLITEEHRLRCRKLKYEHTGIGNIYFRFMYGTTIHAFRNYADANEIDVIFLPHDYKFRSVVRDSVDPTSWFKRSGIRMVTMSTAAPQAKPVTQPVSPQPQFS